MDVVNCFQINVYIRSLTTGGVLDALNRQVVNCFQINVYIRSLTTYLYIT